MAGPSRVFGRSGSRGWLIVPVALMLLSGGSSQAVSRCASLTQIPGKNGFKAIDDGSLSPAQFAEAALVCTRSFETANDPSAGLAVGKAEYRLGRYEEALKWTDRLKGTTGEAGIWGIAAAVYQKRGDRNLERTARERVVSLRLAANDHREAWCVLPAVHRRLLGWQPPGPDRVSPPLVRGGRASEQPRHAGRSNSSHRLAAPRDWRPE